MQITIDGKPAKHIKPLSFDDDFEIDEHGDLAPAKPLTMEAMMDRIIANDPHLSALVRDRVDAVSGTTEAIAMLASKVGASVADLTSALSRAANAMGAPLIDVVRAATTLANRVETEEWVFREGAAVYGFERSIFDLHEGVPVPVREHRRRAAVNAFFERTGRMPRPRKMKPVLVAQAIHELVITGTVKV